MKKSCPECGYPLYGGEKSCPECGYPLHNTSNQYRDYQAVQPQTQQPFSANLHSQTQINEAKEKTDWANYYYECAVIAWEVFKKYFCFKGRASRREYWSFWIILILPSLVFPGMSLILFFPWLGVTIRRYHDIGKCGWWCLCPFANFFLLFKKSDDYSNLYGNPEPAKNLL